MRSDAFTVWFTGITRSGKSTLARMLRDRLIELGWSVELLDSGKIRQRFSSDLGFTREEIARNLKRLAYECQLLNRNGAIAIAAAVSPYAAIRAEIRTDIERFVEVFCDAPVEALLQRDADGLLQRARRGEIPNVAGINAPYEAPTNPELHLDTARLTPEQCLAQILKTLEALHYIPAAESSAYTREEEDMIKERLRNLGYM